MPLAGKPQQFQQYLQPTGGQDLQVMNLLNPVSQIPSTALWAWDTSQSPPVLLGYSAEQFANTGTQRLTKTGLTANDVRNLAAIPLIKQGLNPQPYSDTELIQYIRYAEDELEQFAGILLCPTQVAAPDEVTSQSALAAGLRTITGSGAVVGQREGVDFDYTEPPYDFDYRRFKDEGWGFLSLRKRPLQRPVYGQDSYTAINNFVYIYPLLSQFFRIPPTWYVEDKYFGLLRIVPSENIQMLPLFAMQLALMGFAETLAGAIHIQYVAGFTDADYAGRFSFIKRLVLTEAVILALASMQITVNVGLIESEVTVDGLNQKSKWQPSPFESQINEYRKQAKELKQRVINELTGPYFNYL